MTQFELDLGVPVVESKSDPNPMVNAFGYGPDGKHCKHCKHLIKKQYAGTYYKCTFRKNTNGPGSDHRVNWKACSRFDEQSIENV